jgi:DNA primase
MRYPPTVLDEIKQRLSLVEEVRKSVPDLKRKGKFWWACCPFHHEKTPSFHVREEDQHYHCFGCGAHGDILAFVQEVRGGTFPDTVEYLAGLAGVKLPEIAHDPAAEKARNDGLKALARAHTFYQRHLSQVEAYLAQRGLTEEIAQTFGLGFAPDSWDETRHALLAEGFSPAILREIGLAIKSEKGKGDYDRFRGRLMFPIHNMKDHVVGFGGRIVGEGEPKYLNSPETDFFNKSYLLYNLNRARHHIRQEAQALLVEGYMDVIALWQAGIKSAVAPMGTAVTPEQIKILWQHHAAPIVCLDGDAAGQAAAGRLARRILPALVPGKTLRFVWLPAGEDPDTYIQRQGRQAFDRLLASPATLESVLWQGLTAEVDLTTGEGRAQVEAALQAVGRDMTDAVVRRHITAALKDRLWQSRTGQGGPAPSLVQGRGYQVPHTRGDQGARFALAIACRHPWLVAKFDAEISEIYFENQEDKDIQRFLLQARLEKRLATEDFDAYLEACDAKEQVAHLCESMLIDRQLAHLDGDEEMLVKTLRQQLADVAQRQVKMAQRQEVFSALREEMSPERWQELQALNERRHETK